MAATKTLEERKKDFELKLKEIYPDYTLESGYVNADTYIFLKHKDGYLWKTKPRFLDGKRQCPEVALSNKPKTKSFKLTKEEWQQRLNDKFGIDEYLILDEVKTGRTQTRIFHKSCQREFESSLDNMIYTSKLGCTLCYSKTAKTKEQVQTEIDLIDDSYEVLSVHSKEGHRYMLCRHNNLKCNNHEFEMRVSDFLSKHSQRCPVCGQIELDSKAVKNIEHYLVSNQIKFKREVKIGAKNIVELPYDFYLEKFNLLIEYDGSQHCLANHFFNSREGFEIRMLRDDIKTKFALENGYKLLRINYKQDEIQVLSNYLNSLD